MYLTLLINTYRKTFEALQSYFYSIKGDLCKIILKIVNFLYIYSILISNS